MSEAGGATSLLPPVRVRRGVGIRTVTMDPLPLMVTQTEHLLEVDKAWGDPCGSPDGVHDGLLCLQPVAGDQYHRGLGSPDDALLDQLLEHADRHASGGPG